MRQAARIVEELNPLLLRARDGDRPALARPDGRARPRRGAPGRALRRPADVTAPGAAPRPASELPTRIQPRSEEHTSELQSLRHLVCRLLLGTKTHQQHARAPVTTIPNTRFATTM